MTIGERIRAARKAKGLSQGELARLVGCSDCLISHIERGYSGLPRERREAFADALGLSIADLTPLDAATLDVAIGALVQIGGCDRAIVRLRELRVEASS